MTKLTHNLGIKVICIFLALISGFGAFTSIVGILFAGESGIFSDTPKSYYETPWCENTTFAYADNVVRWYIDGASPEDLAKNFSGENTNFAFELYDPNGNLVAWSDLPEQIGMTASYSYYYNEVRNPDGTYTYYDAPVAYTVTSYVASPLSASDNYWLSFRLYSLTISLGYWLFLIAGCSILIFLGLLAYLLCAAGHRDNSNEIFLNIQDRIPLDLYGFLIFGLAAFTGSFLQSSTYYGNPDLGYLMLIVLTIFILETLFLAAIMTLATRLKKGHWWENTILYRIGMVFFRMLGWLWGVIKDSLFALPATWKVAVGWLIVSTIYLANSYHAASTLFLNFILLIVFCAVAAQWQKLSRAGKQLSEGNLEYKVNTRRMLRSFRQHGENLNNISKGIAIALNQKMKSEHLRTELITNVSHDIKTPLTSIINYVDLLKKEGVTGQAAEYVDVLDRQSRRLKKLTDDLVEASKASTGNIRCSLMPTDITELIQQAVAEYEEKLEKANLEAIITSPENETLYALADGNLMWRVLSNLLSNACKYSQTGTRVYLSVKGSGDTILITVKNVSRDQLNIDPDELMERFVRGDSSRSTEGSGLGLNIARSLVELQKGKFSLSIDGDLFKAQIRCPRAASPAKNEDRLTESGESPQTSS